MSPPLRNWKWYLNNDLLAIQGPSNDDYYPMLAFAELVPGSVAATPGIAFDFFQHFFSPENQPLSIDWGPGGETNPPRVHINLLDGDPDAFLSVFLQRWNHDLTKLRQAYSFVSDRFQVNLPGIRQFVGFSTIPQPSDHIQGDGTSPVASDRVALVCRWERDSLDKGAGPLIMETGTVNNFCEVPIKMGVSSIVWNGNVLNFPSPPSTYVGRRRSDRIMVVSQGGIPSTSLRNLWDFVDSTWENLSDRAFERSLRAWYAWAARGRPFSFSLDQADNQFTTLDGGAAAGQAAIPVTDGTGFTVGNSYLIRQDQGDEEEMIVVLTSTASLVTADANLKFSYGSGDVLKSRDHHGSMVLLDDDYPVDENLTTYDLRLRLREDRS